MAPLFQNSDYISRKPNMIVFDNHQVYGIPHFIHMVPCWESTEAGEMVKSRNRSGEKPPVYRGTFRIMCEKRKGLSV